MIDKRCKLPDGVHLRPFIVLLAAVLLLTASAWPQLFRVAQEYAAGLNPQSVVTADFNGDGKDDLAIAAAEHKVNVLVNNGDGTFQTEVAYPIGNEADALLLWDWNGDGKPDLVVPAAGSVSVLLSNGDGSFQTHQEYPVSGSTPRAIISDFNGDGRVDLAFPSSDGVEVQLESSDGTFSESFHYVTAPFYTGKPAAGDLNGDGKVDLVVRMTDNRDFCNSFVLVFLGNGDGSFRFPHSYAIGCVGGGMLIRDLNHDGKMDLVVGSFFNVSILLGNGDGTFVTYPELSSTDEVEALSTGDLDGDGRLDLVITGNQGTVSVFLGNGDGTFQANQDYETRFGPVSVAVGHFHSANVLDLVTTNTGSSVTVFPGYGDGTFAAVRDFMAPSGVGSIAVDDINNDGYSDIVTTTACCVPPSISVLLGHGDGTFSPFVTYPTFFINALVLADVNSDGKPDLVIADESPNTQLSLSVMLGSGDGTFQSSVDYPISANGTSVVVADFNVDGKVDVAVPGDGEIAVLLGSGDGTFQAEHDYSTGTTTCGMAVGDFNQDGFPDIAVSACVISAASVLLGNGDGTFRAHRDLLTRGQPFSVSVADMNGDGRQDLVVASAESNDIGWISVFLGNGDGTFQSRQDYAAASLVTTAAIGDFNGDGKLDVSATDFQLAVFLGNGDGTLQPRVGYPAKGGKLIVADVNGDRKPDLLTANGAVGIVLNAITSPFYRLSIAATGSGGGTVIVDPGGTRCNGKCSRDLVSGTSLTLSVTADTRSAFSGWSGSVCSGTETCSLTLTTDETITASFTLTPDFALTASTLTPGSVNPGQSATSTIEVVAIGDFNSPVALTCSVTPIPEFAPQCSITPSSVSPGSSATLKVTTTGPQASMTSSGRSVSLVFALYLTVFGLVLVTMVVTGYDMRRRCLVIIPLLFVTLLLLPACSNGNGSHRSRGTPSGAYTITVKGASGATHATSVQVSVY